MSVRAKCDLADLIESTASGWQGVKDAIERGTRQFGDFEAVDWFFDPIVGGGYYGEGCHEQDHEGEIFIVLKNGEEHFRKIGRSGSYSDDHYWDGPIQKVSPKKVIKTVYEWESQV